MNSVKFKYSMLAERAPPFGGVRFCELDRNEYFINFDTEF